MSCAGWPPRIVPTSDEPASCQPSARATALRQPRTVRQYLRGETDVSSSIMETQLIRSLQAEPELARRGCSVAATGEGILVTRPGVTRGLWRWRGGAFVYTPQDAGSAAADAETIAEAVQYTLNVICGAP